MRWCLRNTFVIMSSLAGMLILMLVFNSGIGTSTSSSIDTPYPSSSVSFAGKLDTNSLPKSSFANINTQIIQKKTLRIGNDGTFKIVHFTDLHFGESDLQDRESKESMKSIIQMEKPDFVILGGDQVSDYAFSKGPERDPLRWLQKHIDSIGSVLTESGVTWASIQGNHDILEGIDPLSYARIDSRNNHSLTQSSNNANYVLHVFPPLDSPTSLFPRSNISSSTPLLNFLMFNTQKHGCLSGYLWGCLSPMDIKRFQDLPDSSAPSMAFLHIPLQEMLAVHNDGEFYGSQDDGDGISCMNVNTGLAANFAFNGNVKVVTFGHDHGNNFFGQYYGVNLVYGAKSGYGGYKGKPHGAARVYLVSFSGDQAIKEESNRFNRKSVRDAAISTQNLAIPLTITEPTNLLTSSSFTPSYSKQPVNYRIDTWIRYDNGDRITQKKVNKDTVSPMHTCEIRKPSPSQYAHSILACVGIGLIVGSYILELSLTKRLLSAVKCSALNTIRLLKKKTKTNNEQSFFHSGAPLSSSRDASPSVLPTTRTTVFSSKWNWVSICSWILLFSGQLCFLASILVAIIPMISFQISSKPGNQATPKSIHFVVGLFSAVLVELHTFYSLSLFPFAAVFRKITRSSACCKNREIPIVNDEIELQNVVGSDIAPDTESLLRLDENSINLRAKHGTQSLNKSLVSTIMPYVGIVGFVAALLACFYGFRLADFRDQQVCSLIIGIITGVFTALFVSDFSSKASNTEYPK